MDDRYSLQLCYEYKTLSLRANLYSIDGIKHPLYLFKSVLKY